MPNVNVSTRVVEPNLGKGILTGLIAGAAVTMWLTLLGGITAEGLASIPVYVSSLVGGIRAFDFVGFNGQWMAGVVLLLSIFAAFGLIFALMWPTLRRAGIILPVLAFWLAAYLIVFQLAGRVLQPQLAERVSDFALVTGFLVAGIIFVRQYRRA